MKKLNGWQRIGVVLTVIYIALISFIIFEKYQSERNKVTFEQSNEIVIYKKPKGTYLSIEDQINNCIKDKIKSLKFDYLYNKDKPVIAYFTDEELNSVSLKGVDTDIIKKDCQGVNQFNKEYFIQYYYEKSPNYLGIFFIVFIIPLLVWLLVYLIIYTIKWIIKGFKLT